MPHHSQVLVAVSDPESGRTLQHLLSDFGYDPLLASSLREARAILSKQSVPLVFCEAQLADGSFRELLQSTKPGRIPLVVAARLPDTRQYLEAMSLGAFDFVASPFRRAEVQRILANVLHGSAASTRSGTPQDVAAVSH